MSTSQYHLDLHSQAILDEYRSNLTLFQKTSADAIADIKEKLAKADISVVAVESRVKTEKSLAGKLELKG